jgi:anti-sigma regulatory factor (Ser/Thr protein kinase)
LPPDAATEFQATISGAEGSLGAAQAAFAAYLAGHAADARLVNRAGVLLEEVARNALLHGGAGAVSLRATMRPDGCLMVFEDDGAAFDPTTAPLPAPPANLAAAPIGGRGLILIRRFAAGLAYGRQDARNRLEIRLARS